MSSPEHPTQPLVKDEHGTVRFKKNQVVRFLCDTSKTDMNALWKMLGSGMFTIDDMEQFLTKQEHRAQIAKLAKESFKDHKLHQEGPGRWFCARPGTGIYSFHVACFNGCVVLYGDVGELILRPSDRDSLAWLRGAIDSMDYVLGKAPSPWPEKVFLEGEMKNALHEIGGELAGKVKESYEDSDEMMPKGTAWDWACFSNSIDDWPSCQDWSAGMLWTYHALETFCELMVLESEKA